MPSRPGRGCRWSPTTRRRVRILLHPPREASCPASWAATAGRAAPGAGHAAPSSPRRQDPAPGCPSGPDCSLLQHLLAWVLLPTKLAELNEGPQSLQVWLLLAPAQSLPTTQSARLPTGHAGEQAEGRPASQKPASRALRAEASCLQEGHRAQDSPRPMGKTPRHTIGPGVWNQELDRRCPALLPAGGSTDMHGHSCTCPGAEHMWLHALTHMAWHAQLDSQPRWG